MLPKWGEVEVTPFGIIGLRSLADSINSLMFSLSTQLHYYLYKSPCDMRKGFNGLSGLVRNELERDPLSGEVFIFVNRRRNRMKLLVWDGDGFLIYYKALERGSFQLPDLGGQAIGGTIKWEELLFIVKGIELQSIKKRKRFSLGKTG